MPLKNPHRTSFASIICFQRNIGSDRFSDIGAQESIWMEVNSSEFGIEASLELKQECILLGLVF